MKKVLQRLLVLLLVVAAPLISFVTVVELLDDPYQNTYLGAFEAKYDRLYEAEGKKIVFIGGSSLAFGLRSDLIEEELGGEYTVVNFGLYATLGTKFMMDMAKDAIGEGDIVILCPEISEQTYSLYFNPEAVLQANDGFSAKLLRLPVKHQLSLVYQYYRYAFDKIEYAVKNNAPDPIGVYRADSFNEWGDMDVEMPNNIMNNGVDSNMLIKMDETLLDAEFIDYVNDYVADIRKKDAEIYFSYSPVNRMALRSSAATRAAFEEELGQLLDCPIFGEIEDYLIDNRYFYDTNFHLNEAGAIYFSNQLALTLKKELDMEPITTISVPKPPALAANTTVEVEDHEGLVDFDRYLGEPNNDYVDWFEYELRGSSYAIVGVKPAHLNMTEVILPSVYNGKNITELASGALWGCAELKNVHIGLTYKSLAAEAFSGCVSLEGIYLYELDGNRIAPPGDGLMDGAPATAKIYIPEGANYTSGYTWSNYIDRFDTFVREVAE